ncbi:MAG: hypothetical protein KJ977_01865, partial [Candidatus Omnitrophica bacterium]|nr:hypothetical protein [Candidatus Omnitrophota bacterium]
MSKARAVTVDEDYVAALKTMALNSKVINPWVVYALKNAINRNSDSADRAFNEIIKISPEGYVIALIRARFGVSQRFANLDKAITALAEVDQGKDILEGVIKELSLNIDQAGVKSQETFAKLLMYAINQGNGAMVDKLLEFALKSENDKAMDKAEDAFLYTQDSLRTQRYLRALIVESGRDSWSSSKRGKLDKLIQHGFDALDWADDTKLFIQLAEDTALPKHWQHLLQIGWVKTTEKQERDSRAEALTQEMVQLPYSLSYHLQRIFERSGYPENMVALNRALLKQAGYQQWESELKNIWWMSLGAIYRKKGGAELIIELSNDTSIPNDWREFIASTPKALLKRDWRWPERIPLELFADMVANKLKNGDKEKLLVIVAPDYDWNTVFLEIKPLIDIFVKAGWGVIYDEAKTRKDVVTTLAEATKEKKANAFILLGHARAGPKEKKEKQGLDLSHQGRDSWIGLSDGKEMAALAKYLVSDETGAAMVDMMEKALRKSKPRIVEGSIGAAMLTKVKFDDYSEIAGAEWSDGKDRGYNAVEEDDDFSDSLIAELEDSDSEVEADQVAVETEKEFKAKVKETEQTVQALQELIKALPLSLDRAVAKLKITSHDPADSNRPITEKEIKEGLAQRFERFAQATVKTAKDITADETVRAYLEEEMNYAQANSLKKQAEILREFFDRKRQIFKAQLNGWEGQPQDLKIYATTHNGNIYVEVLRPGVLLHEAGVLAGLNHQQNSQIKDKYNQARIEALRSTFREDMVRLESLTKEGKQVFLRGITVDERFIFAKEEMLKLYIQRLKELGVNVVHAYLPAPKLTLDRLAEAGIGINLAFPLNEGAYTEQEIPSGAYQDLGLRTLPNLSDDSYLSYISATKDHPAISAWIWGNEYNLLFAKDKKLAEFIVTHKLDLFDPEVKELILQLYKKDTPNTRAIIWYIFANKTAERAKAYDSKHPLGISNAEIPGMELGKGFNLEVGKRITYLANAFDFWALHIYRGRLNSKASFTSLFEDWHKIQDGYRELALGYYNQLPQERRVEAESMLKPPAMYVAEFGEDSWDADKGSEDQQMQEEAMLQLQHEIVEAAIKSKDYPYPLIFGFTAMSFMDHIDKWKEAAALEVKESIGVYTKPEKTKQDPGYYPSQSLDRQSNEEWWGFYNSQAQPKITAVTLGPVWSKLRTTEQYPLKLTSFIIREIIPQWIRERLDASMLEVSRKIETAPHKEIKETKVSALKLRDGLLYLESWPQYQREVFSDQQRRSVLVFWDSRRWGALPEYIKNYAAKVSGQDERVFWVSDALAVEFGASAYRKIKAPELRVIEKGQIPAYFKQVPLDFIVGGRNSRYTSFTLVPGRRVDLPGREDVIVMEGVTKGRGDGLVAKQIFIYDQRNGERIAEARFKHKQWRVSFDRDGYKTPEELAAMILDNEGKVVTNFKRYYL